jgi:hypothetical protein
MKKVLTISTAALFALSVFADDAKKTTTTNTKKATAPAVTGTVLDAQPSQVTSADSPLVAAAKRSSRKGKKPTNVITNETVKKPSKAHVTTSHNVVPLPVLPPASGPTEDQLRKEKADREYAANAAKLAAEKKQKEKEARERRMAAAAAAAESDYVDPGQAESELAEAQKAAKEQEKKPPQE